MSVSQVAHDEQTRELSAIEYLDYVFNDRKWPAIYAIMHSQETDVNKIHHDNSTVCKAIDTYRARKNKVATKIATSLKIS